MFGYRTFYFIGLLSLLVSDRILGTEHTISLPVCLLGLVGLILSAGLSHRQHRSPLPAFYISLSIIGYASWWMGGLGGQQFMSVTEDALLQWQVFFNRLAHPIFG